MKYKLPLFMLSLLVFSVIARAQVQDINTFAGTGDAAFGGDGANASGADLWGPVDVAIDGAGNVYISDHFNYRVRKVNSTGLITTIAGNGIGGYLGDGSIGSSAEITPRGLAVDKNNNLYISDAVSNVVRKVNTLGLISTVVGGNGRGYSGDGGQASAAKLNNPSGITFDKNGNLYIADYGNGVVRKVNTSGIISTVAGKDSVGYSGDGGAATAAKLDSPYAVTVDRYGNLFIADYGNDVIRMVDTENTISTYAGTQGVYTYAGDAGAATAATLDGPRGVAVDTFGNLYISDANNNVIRKVTASTGIITTVAGNGDYGYGGDLGFATGANLFNPYGLAVDVYGSIYIADANNERVRRTYYPNLGVNKITTASGIEVYPNPSGSYITVSGLQAADKVCVNDVLGRQVSEVWEVTGKGPQTFNTNSLVPGVYLLKVSNEAGNNTATIRLIKE